MAGKMAAKPAEKEENYWVSSLRDDLKERFGGNNAYQKPLKSIEKLMNLDTLDDKRKEWVSTVFDMAARTGMESENTPENKYVKNLEAVGKAAETLLRYKDDPAIISVVSGYLKGHLHGGVDFTAEIAGRIAERFAKYESTIKKFSGTDANAMNAVVYCVSGADQKDEGAVIKALNDYEGLIKKYQSLTASSVLSTLVEAEEKGPKIAAAAANAIQKYEGHIAGGVAKFISSALSNRPGTEEGVIRTFDEQADVINKLEGSTAQTAVKILGSIANEDPKCAAHVAAAIDKYEGKSAVKVVGAFSRIWQGGAEWDRYKEEPSVAAYEKAASALTKHADVIKRYEGGAQEGVAQAIAFSAISEKGSSNEAARALTEHEGVIKRYEGDVARLVAIHISEAAAYGGREKGAKMSKAYADYEGVIKKQTGDMTTSSAAILLAASVDRNQDVKKVAAAMDKYEGKIAENVIMALTNVSEKKPQMLIEVSEAVLRLEDSEAFSEYQKEKMDLSAAPYRFRKSYRFTGEGVVVETPEAENKALYSEGMKIINGIRKGSIKLDPDVEFLHSELEGEKAKALEMRKRLKESRGTDMEAAQFLEGYRKRKDGLKKEDIEQIRGRLQESYTTDKLKEELSQLSQHFMGGKPAKDAANISERLVVSGEDVKAGKIELSVLPRSMNSIPTYGEYRCCAFAGYQNDFVKLVEYKLNPAIELLQLKAGDNNAIAITAKTTAEDGKKVLLVDSFEAGTHVFGSDESPNKKVVDTAMKLIMDYAKAEGFDEVLVSGKPHNSTPKIFYKTIEAEETKEPLKLKLDSNITEPYLEAGRIHKTDLLAGTGKLFKVEKD